MKAAIYCRLSEEDRDKRHWSDDSDSIRNQKALLLQHCLEKGWEVYGIYSDDDRAGADRQRPEFLRLLRDAEAGRFDIVLCKTQSRFTREMELVEKYIHGLFPLWGIRFVSVVDNADTAERGNKKSRQINGLVNEWYLEDLSDNIRSVLNNRRENGYHIGSFALYGYKKDPEHPGRLLVDEEAAAVVREVFTLFSEGYGKTAIARMLNERGVPNPTAYKRQQGLRYRSPTGKNSELWKYFAIADMLGNETYIGNLVQGKYGSVSYKTKKNRPRPKESWYRAEGTHEPIIERPLWDRVQALLEQRAKPFAGGQIGLFAGKARCAGCGYTLRSSKSHGRRYLRCPNRHVSKGACEGAFISEERLAGIVLEELRRLTREHLDLEKLAQAVRPGAGLTKRKARLCGELNACQRELEACERGLRELYKDRARGLLTEEEHVSLRRGFAEDRERLERAAARGRAELAKLEERMEQEGDARALIRRYTALETLTRQAVDVMIDHILVGRRAPGESHTPVEIHWNF